MLIEWLRVFGRFHPLVLHLPIGLLVGVAFMELLARKSPGVRIGASVLAWFAAAMAVFAAATGYVLSLEGEYTGSTIDTHMWLGIGVAGCAVVFAALYSMSARSARPARVWTARAFLLVTLGVLIPAGHYGGVLVRGDGYVTAPLRGQAASGKPAPSGSRGSDPSVLPAADGSSFQVVIAPIFQARCVGCHNEERRKGGLVLAGREGISAGGKGGPVLDQANPGEGELITRLKLPIDDIDHMPPEDKKQLTEGELKAIEQWVSAGAPFEGVVPGLEAGAPKPASASEAAPPPAPAKPLAAADAGAIAKLREALVHVEPVARDSHLLCIDFAATAKQTDDARAAGLLEPVRVQVADLSLAGSGVTDQVVLLVARMPNLRRLDLRQTGVTDAGLAALAKHRHLEDLVLVQTRLSDGAVDHLLALPALKSVYLWNSGIGAEAVARLRVERPELRIDTGETADAAVLETEAEVKVGGAATSAPAGAVPGAGADALKPINTVCPVAGTPINPEYTIVYKGRVIGFCCQHCPVQFWADPAKFEAKLP